MGATDFAIKSRGKSASDAYSRAVDIAEDEYGNDPYNGTISTTNGFKDVTEEYKKCGKTLNEFINDKLDRADKRNCFAVEMLNPVGNELKTKSQVEHTTTPGTKKWLLKYVVYEGPDALKSFDTKGDAVKYAREYTEKHQCTTRIDMQKVLEKGSPTVAKVHYKRSTKERDGEWMFFGMAAC